MASLAAPGSRPMRSGTCSWSDVRLRMVLPRCYTARCALSPAANSALSAMHCSLTPQIRDTT